MGFIKPRYSEAFAWYKLRKAIYDYFKSEAKEGMKVLEVGCSAGANIYMMNELLPDAKEMEFYGIDISPEGIKAARERREEEQMKNCFFNVGDAECLGYNDSNFDIVICTEVIEHLLHPKIALTEIYRVLRAGGVAIITTPNSANVFRKIAGKRIKSLLEREVEKRDPHEVRHGSYGHISVLSSKELISMCKEVGFRIEKIRKASIIYGLPFHDRHQILFAMLLIIDSILDRLPRNYDFSWSVVLKLRKPAEATIRRPTIIWLN